MRRHKDELVARYETGAETPGAFRALVHDYLTRKDLIFLEEVNKPDKDEDPVGYRQYQDHRTLLYDPLWWDACSPARRRSARRRSARRRSRLEDLRLDLRLDLT